MSSIIETDLFVNALNFSITSKALLNKDIIATVENVVKDLEKEEATTIRATLHFSYLSFEVIVIWYINCSFTSWQRYIYCEEYLEKYIDHINNGPYQLLKKDITTKIEAKTLKQLKVLKDNEIIDNKLCYYLKPTYTPAPRFYGQPKIHKPGVHMRTIVSYCGFSLYNLKKYIANIFKLMSKMKVTTPRILPRFPTISEMSPLKMTR